MNIAEINIAAIKRMQSDIDKFNLSPEDRRVLVGTLEIHKWHLECIRDNRYMDIWDQFSKAYNSDFLIALGEHKASLERQLEWEK